MVTRVFPRFPALYGSLVVLSLSSYWLLQLYSFLLIDRRDYSGFGFYDTQS